MTTIQEFYKEKNILISGGTGFIGKVLVEKLLRSCDGIKKIYLLMREKKNKSIEDRLEEYKKDVVFQLVREKCPERFNCLHALSSELTKEQLGLSEESIKLVSEVHLVFHCAASVRFDDPLKEALLKNTRGTFEMLKLGLNMPFIQAFVHVSTTYCQANVPTIEEKLYPAQFDWKTAIKLAETLSTDELNAVSYKLSCYMPNTYVFTKALAESCVESFKDALPCIILRPSIVTGSEAEPMPGYVDNFNGPMGILIATSTGTLRTQWMPTIGELNGIPVDTCVKGMITAAYVKAVVDDKHGDLPVYNAASAKIISYLDLIKTCRKHVGYHYPPEMIIWRPGGRITKCMYEFYIRLIFTQILPAILIDTIMRVSNVKPFLLKLQRLFYNAQVSLRYYSNHKWTIHNEKFYELMTKIPERELETFGFDEKMKDIVKYIQTCYLGIRRYLLKQDDSTIESSKEKLKKFTIADEILKYTVLSIIIWQLLKRFYF